MLLCINDSGQGTSWQRERTLLTIIGPGQIVFTLLAVNSRLLALDLIFETHRNILILAEFNGESSSQARDRRFRCTVSSVSWARDEMFCTRNIDNTCCIAL